MIIAFSHIPMKSWIWRRVGALCSVTGIWWTVRPCTEGEGNATSGARLTKCVTPSLAKASISDILLGADVPAILEGFNHEKLWGKPFLWFSATCSSSSIFKFQGHSQTVESVFHPVSAWNSSLKEVSRSACICSFWLTKTQTDSEWARNTRALRAPIEWRTEESQKKGIPQTDTVSGNLIQRKVMQRMTRRFTTDPDIECKKWIKHQHKGVAFFLIKNPPAFFSFTLYAPYACGSAVGIIKIAK